MHGVRIDTGRADAHHLSTPQGTGTTMNDLTALTILAALLGACFGLIRVCARLMPGDGPSRTGGAR